MQKDFYNVLFISADQWRAECLSILGHPYVKTPNLDSLAKEGVLFKKHYTVTSPCGPSRSSLLTGTYLMNHRAGRNGTPLDRRFTNIAREARMANYDPMLFGYTDTGADPNFHDKDDPALTTYEGVMPGFSVGLQLSDKMEAWIKELHAKNYRFHDRNDIFKPRADHEKPVDRGHSYIPPIFTAEDSETAFMGRAIRNYISETKSGWFVHGVFLRPHPPFIAPEPYNALYHPKDMPLPKRRPSPEEEARQHPHLKSMITAIGNMRMEHHPIPPLEMNDLEIQQIRATYLALITQVDEEIGRIIAQLKEMGEYDRTLIIFTVDHAEMLGDHHCWGKEAYFEQSFHIPLIIRDPRPSADQTRGKSYDHLTESVDIVPTILEWLGQSIPDICDGHSLMPFIQGTPPSSWREYAFTELDFRTSPNASGFDAEEELSLTPDQCSLAIMRNHHYKYVHFTALPPLLFDLKKDPFEFENLIDHPDYQTIRVELMHRMLNWRLLHVDRTLTNIQLAPGGPYINHPKRAFI